MRLFQFLLGPQAWATSQCSVCRVEPTRCRCPADSVRRLHTLCLRFVFLSATLNGISHGINLPEKQNKPQDVAPAKSEPALLLRKCSQQKLSGLSGTDSQMNMEIGSKLASPEPRLSTPQMFNGSSSKEGVLLLQFSGRRTNKRNRATLESALQFTRTQHMRVVAFLCTAGCTRSCAVWYRQGKKNVSEKMPRKKCHSAKYTI